MHNSGIYRSDERGYFPEKECVQARFISLVRDSTASATSSSTRHCGESGLENALHEWWTGFGEIRPREP